MGLKRLLDPRRCVLLVIDPQERLMKAVRHEERVIKNSVLLIRAAQEFEMPILATTQYVKGLGPFVPEIQELLSDLPVIDKMEFNSFLNSEFQAAVDSLPSSVDTMIITGVEAHICIYQTSMGALEAGFNVWVADDAVSSRAKRNYKSAIRLLLETGVSCAPSELILYQWLQRAGTLEFKALLPFLK